MKRLGQTAIALVAAAGACVGGAAAIASTTGVSPTQFLSPSPAATLHAITDAVLPTGGASARTSNATLQQPSTHAVSGASGAGATPASARTSAGTATPRSHARSGASGATGTSSAAQGSMEREDDREED